MKRSVFLQRVFGSFVGGWLAGGFLQKIYAAAIPSSKPEKRIVPVIHPLAVPRTSKGSKNV
ncbi:MAG: hypothetical protein NTV54_08125 [Ignavibacteriales bacterium]|nr:hypothetical protein [Ignavibacteriales bacterium]